MGNRPDLSGEIAARNIESNEDIAADQLRARSKMFFAGLSFAVLSFIGSHPIVTHSLILKFIETISLLSLFFAGIILLLRLEQYVGPLKKFKSIEEYLKSPSYYLYKKTIIFIFYEEKSYWPCFIFGIAGMLVDRVAVLFLN
ncbi:MAG: hypothetical protein K2X50_07660 [Gammaproteobacteria bacterium]|nr:hypothetical protein [Gammaproteobacteria bacterium]